MEPWDQPLHQKLQAAFFEPVAHVQPLMKDHSTSYRQQHNWQLQLSWKWLKSSSFPIFCDTKGENWPVWSRFGWLGTLMVFSRGSKFPLCINKSLQYHISGQEHPALKWIRWRGPLCYHHPILARACAKIEVTCSATLTFPLRFAYNVGTALHFLSS
jgi:hypothetical protein